MCRLGAFFVIACVLSAACGTALDIDDGGPTPPSPDDGGMGADGGDGAVGPDGGGPTDGAGPSDAPPDGIQLPVKRIFVLAAKATGDMNFGAGTGRGAADTKCAEEAMAAGLGNAYRAWLSTAAEPAINRIPSGVRWTLSDGTTPVFSSTADIALGNAPLAPLDRTAAGMSLLTNTTNVWTGTTSVGQKATNTCADWMQANAGATGHVGVIGDTTSKWTDSAATACSSPSHVLCFEY